MAFQRKGPPNVGTTRRASDNKQTFRIRSNYNTRTSGTLPPINQNAPLCEPLRRLQWLRQELDNWNRAEGARPISLQPTL